MNFKNIFKFIGIDNTTNALIFEKVNYTKEASSIIGEYPLLEAMATTIWFDDFRNNWEVRGAVLEVISNTVLSYASKVIPNLTKDNDNELTKADYEKIRIFYESNDNREDSITNKKFENVLNQLNDTFFLRFASYLEQKKLIDDNYKYDPKRYAEKDSYFTSYEEHINYLKEKWDNKVVKEVGSYYIGKINSLTESALDRAASEEIEETKENIKDNDNRKKFAKLDYINLQLQQGYAIGYMSYCDFTCGMRDDYEGIEIKSNKDDIMYNYAIAISDLPYVAEATELANNYYGDEDEYKFYAKGVFIYNFIHNKEFRESFKKEPYTFTSTYDDDIIESRKKGYIPILDYKKSQDYIIKAKHFGWDEYKYE